MTLSFDGFGRLIADELENSEEIHRDASLTIDLGLESFEVCRLVVLVEDLLDEQIPDDLIPQLQTVGDLYSYYEARSVESGPG